MIPVQLPDGSIKEYPDDSTPLDVAASLGSRLAAAVLAAQVNGKVVDAVKTGQPADALSGTLARDALRICHAEAKSIAAGKPVKV